MGGDEEVKIITFADLVHILGNLALWRLAGRERFFRRKRELPSHVKLGRAGNQFSGQNWIFFPGTKSFFSALIYFLTFVKIDKFSFFHEKVAKLHISIEWE